MIKHIQSEPEQQSLTSQGYIKKYLAIIASIFCLTLLGVFLGFNSRANFLIKEQLLKQARAYSQEVTLVRQWIADHGGVYVKKRPGIIENPYLKEISTLKTAIVDEDNEVYILKNPAMATREISEMASEERFFSFHITSLKPINPQNRPDKFETAALNEFQTSNINEIFQLETSDNESVFRYIIPLHVKESCLQCHEAQGYKVGDIRGGISVSIPASDIIAQIKASKTYIVVFALIVLITITLVILLISNQLISELRRAEKRLYEMATRDFLTGLHNRREGLRRFREEISKSRRNQQSLTLIILDIDHFKNVNDTYGHLAGDMVLQQLTAALIPTLRDYDIFCRYGGEEFLLILPNTSLRVGEEIAERLRRKVEEYKFIIDDKTNITLTISLGVAQLTDNENENSLIYRVDEALYAAKDKGRNCVHFLEKSNTTQE
jgi:diguanylate cyclase (GGDEF)-like protein